jgi:hypothetical protein
MDFENTGIKIKSFGILPNFLRRVIFMNVNQLIRLQLEIILENTNHLEFKDLASLEQSCKEIQTMICEKRIWEKSCEQYGFFRKGINIKAYLRDHTISNSIQLEGKISGFFSGTDGSKNVFFNCLFRKKSGVLEIERIQDTQEKNSLTLLYIGPLNANTKSKIIEKVNDLLEIQEMLFDDSYKKNLQLS